MSGGVYSGGYFEPHNNVKGDVARICLYVYARWGSDFTKCSDITNVFESVDVLLEWCEMDPVDTWEMGRNEVVESIQGNRNVFIDYPELAWILFDREIPADMTTPSGEAKKNAPESNVCDHAFGEWTLSADGVTYESTCSECGEVQILTIEALVASLDSDAEKILLLLTLGASDSLLFEEVSN